MSGLSPSRRLRTKTSDITDFFRPSTSSSSQLRQANDSQIHLSVPQSQLDVPPTQETSALRKMTTKIPFLGRTRKKSTHSVTSGGLASNSSRGYDSTEITDSTSVTTKKDRLSHPVSSPPPESASRQPPLPTTLPPITITSPSIGSKFSAHFPKSRKSSSRPPAAPSEGYTSDTLSLPMTPRAASFDSGSSDASRSPTPRAAVHPTITVSLSPDEEFRDLFTLPRKKISPQKRQFTTPASEYRDNYHDSDSNITLGSTPSTIPRIQFSNPPPGSKTPDGGPHRSSMRRSTKEKHSEEILGADESTDESQNTRGIYPPELSPVIDVSQPPSIARKPSYPISRSRLRTPSTASSRPPSIPLPPPPSSSPIPTISSLKSLPPNRSTMVSRSTRTPVGRPRAHTISAIPPPQSVALAPDTTSSDPRGKAATKDLTAAKQDSDKIDSDNATVQDLKDALAARNRQYEELSSYLLELTATFAAEKKAMEKKIASLEKEAVRKAKEVKGYTWLALNHSSPGTLGSRIPAANPVNPTQVAYRQSPVPTSSRLRMLHGADDSGAESHPTSGAESVQGSATSGTESTTSTRDKKFRGPLNLGATGFTIYRNPSKSSSAKGLGIGSNVPDMPNLSSASKHSSVYSLSSSATSSTSSLLPPSPNATVSSLSAIPEAPSQIPSPPPKPVRESGSLSAGEAEGRERRTSYTSRRISTPSLASTSSSSATNAYAANLKRGRPPSIAQVLDRSPNMENVLEKFRPSAGSSTTAD